MLELDSPLVEDIDASLRYCKDVLDEFRKIKTFNPEPEHVSFIAMGMRHYQRTIVDAATRALKAIAIDLDGSTPDTFEALLKQLMYPNAVRPAFLSSQTQQYLLFVYNQSIIAGLPLTPSDYKEDYEAQRRASMAVGRTMTYLVKELENMRAWCIANVTI